MPWWRGLGLRTSAASLLVLIAVVGLAHTLTARSTEARMQAELDAAAQSILMRALDSGPGRAGLES